MKKLHLTLIALFVLLAAQAQKITEKDLLGEWKIAKIATDGVTINFEKDEVTFSSALKEMAENSGEDMDQVKEMIKSQMGAEAGNTRLIFKTGAKMEVIEGDATETHTYILAEENCKQYISLSDEPTSKTELFLEDGLLRWMQDGSPDNIMYLRKLQK